MLSKGEVTKEVQRFFGTQMKVIHIVDVREFMGEEFAIEAKPYADIAGFIELN